INAPLQTPTGSGSVIDSNGNQLTTTNSGGTTAFTDTLGLTALTVSGSGTPASPVTYTYTPPGGGSAVVTVKYTAYTVQTSFACRGISEFPATSENLLSEIDLPDSTSYTFGYDSSGRLTSVHLPNVG